MRFSGWSGRRVRARWLSAARHAPTGARAEPVERRVHPLFWLGLLMLAALAIASPFISIGAVTLLVMLLRPVAVLAMLLGVVLRR